MSRFWHSLSERFMVAERDATWPDYQSRNIVAGLARLRDMPGTSAEIAALVPVNIPS